MDSVYLERLSKDLIIPSSQLRLMDSIGQGKHGHIHALLLRPSHVPVVNTLQVNLALSTKVIWSIGTIGENHPAADVLVFNYLL